MRTGNQRPTLAACESLGPQHVYVARMRSRRRSILSGGLVGRDNASREDDSKGSSQTYFSVIKNTLSRRVVGNVLCRDIGARLGNSQCGSSVEQRTVDSLDPPPRLFRREDMEGSPARGGFEMGQKRVVVGELLDML